MINNIFSKIKYSFKSFFAGNWLDRPRSVWLVAIIFAFLVFIAVASLIINIAFRVHGGDVVPANKASLPKLEDIDSKKIDSILEEYKRREDILRGKIDMQTFAPDPSVSALIKPAVPTKPAVTTPAKPPVSKPKLEN